MSVRSFKSVFMVASCAGAALGCYLVSLRVATERAALEDVETQIVLAQRDLRLLQTEIGTRGRLAQLERWNAKVIALSAPTADQFLNGSFELAKMTAPEDKSEVTAPVVLASAPKPATPRVVGNDAESEPEPRSTSGPAALMHQASLKRAETPSRTVKALGAPSKPEPKVVPRTTHKSGLKVEAKAKPAAKLDAKVTAKPVAKPKAAVGDPLAPLPVKATAKKVAALNKAATPAKTSKDSAKKQ